MNEKKIRRDIRTYKVAAPCAMVIALGFAAAGWHYMPGQWKSFESWKLLAFVFSLSLEIMALILASLSVLLFTIQRQAEYALYLKEVLTTRSEHSIADPWR